MRQGVVLPETPRDRKNLQGLEEDQLAGSWDFSEVNDLIDRHNRWYPAEARLPMDPTTGDHVLVNGEHYSKRPLDSTWVLERFPLVRPTVRSQRA